MSEGPKYQRSGVWGRPAMGYASLPSQVADVVDSFLDPGLLDDWTQFVCDGNLWFVARCWENPSSYVVVASVVQYESKLVELEDES